MSTRRVILEPYNRLWPEKFKSESIKLMKILNKDKAAIYPIGSTAIVGIYAKPIIDILICVNELSSIDTFNDKFEALGYHCKGEFGIPGRRFYWRGNADTHHYHIHLFSAQDPQAKPMLTHGLNVVLQSNFLKILTLTSPLKRLLYV